MPIISISAQSIIIIINKFKFIIKKVNVLLGLSLRLNRLPLSSFQNTYVYDAYTIIIIFAFLKFIKYISPNTKPNRQNNIIIEIN